MKSCSTNDVKIYNLTASKCLPEWLPDRKRRNLLKKDVDIRRRIELIQDFDMPGVSTSVQVTPDESYILATGIYKPRVRCYDVKNLSMKFERCFDSEVVQFLVLSPDYSKMVFLQCDRYLEFHAQFGRYFRVRIPKFGSDLAYHTPSCDIFVTGATNQVFRLNLELGRFMTSWDTNARSIGKCSINPVHHLLVFGTEEGNVEAWDSRIGQRVATADVGLHCVSATDTIIDGIPSITSLKFKDGLTMGVGTATGQVLLYDVRSNKPLLVKQHYNDMPIKSLHFMPSESKVLSMDKKVIKVWEENTGQPYTAIEGESDFNELCLVPRSGMFFAAYENPKIQTYYVPSLGPAPTWCSFLDSLTEELEESNISSKYDDYKFITDEELSELGLDHLKGSTLLRAHMHGYFVDMRLYRKAKSVANPFDFNEYKKRKIREKLLEGRVNRVKISNLPKVNKELALKLRGQPETSRKGTNILFDDRFKQMFENADFEVDKTTDEYRLINPVLSKHEKKQTKKLEQMFARLEEDEDEVEGKGSSEDDDSSDDDVEWAATMKRKRLAAREEENNAKTKQPNFFELKAGEEFAPSSVSLQSKQKTSKISLGDRFRKASTEVETRGPLGAREMTFQLKSKNRGVSDDFKQKSIQHQMERKKIRRSAGSLKQKRGAWKK